MSAVEDVTLVPTDQQTNLVDAFEYFSRDKEDQLRQLKPFSNKSSAYLTELIQKAWNSFTEDEKALYTEEANYVVPDTEEMRKYFSTKPDSNEDENADDKSDDGKEGLQSGKTNNKKAKKFDIEQESDYEDEDAEYEEEQMKKELPWVFATQALHIYIKEVGKIIYQGNDISCPHHELVKMLWTRGWMTLRQDQRDEYMIRAKKITLLSLDESTLNYTAEKTFEKFESAINFDDQQAQGTFHDDLCTHWVICAGFDKMWYTFTEDQRTVYYDRYYQKLTLEYAQYLYIREAEKKLTPDHGRYCLACDFDNLSDAEKKPYLEESKKRIEEAKTSEDGTVFIWSEINDYNMNGSHSRYNCGCALQTKEYSGTPIIVRQLISQQWFEEDDYNKKIFDDHVWQEFSKEFCNHYRGSYCDDFKWQKWCELTDAQQNEYHEKCWTILYERYASFALLCDNIEKPWLRRFGYEDFCSHCWYENMNAEEKKPYFKRGKQNVKKVFFKRNKKEERKRYTGGWPDLTAFQLYGDTSHIWTEYEESSAYLKESRHISSVEYNAFLSYFKKYMPAFKRQPENQNLSYLRVCEKLERQFWNLPTNKRQPYFDAILRQNELIKLMEPLKYDRFIEANIDSLNESRDPSEEPISSRFKMNETQKLYCLRKLQQARIHFLQDNPDVKDYFYFDRQCIYIHRLTDNKRIDTDKVAKDVLRIPKKKVPTAFICFVHSTSSVMRQNPEFAAKEQSEQRSILKAAWKKLSEEQKAVFHEKRQRVLSRLEMKFFYQKYIGLVPKKSK